MLRKWECLPERMKNDAVRPYYEILEQRQAAIAAKRAMDVPLWSRLRTEGRFFFARNA